MYDPVGSMPCSSEMISQNCAKIRVIWVVQEKGKYKVMRLWIYWFMGQVYQVWPSRHEGASHRELKSSRDSGYFQGR